VAFGGVKASAAADYGFYNYGGLNNTNVGWVAGMGIEHKIPHSMWSFFAEALYYDLGKVTGPSVDNGETYQNAYSVEIVAAKIGFNRHF
jgi:hypothetical protein